MPTTPNTRIPTNFQSHETATTHYVEDAWLHEATASWQGDRALCGYKGRVNVWYRSPSPLSCQTCKALAKYTRRAQGY